jgi:PAS domain S-box-containing protein
MRILTIVFISLLFYTSSFFAQNYRIPLNKSDYKPHFIEVISNETDVNISTINKIYQSSDGYLWICTRLGLFSYNGYNFLNLSKKYKNYVFERDINDIVEDKNGVLWVGCGRGLITLKNEKIRITDIEKSLDSLEVLSLSFDKKGNLWIGTIKGLYTIKDNTIKKYPEFPKDVIYKVYVDSKNSIWVAINGKGILKIDEDKTTHFDKNRIKNSNIFSIYEDHDGNIWFGSYEGDILIYKNGDIKEIYGYDYKKSRTIGSFAEDKEKNLWIATTGNGLLRYKDGIFYSYTTKEGLIIDAIKSVYVDKENNLWIGTYGAGLCRIENSKIKTYTVKDGLPNNSTWNVFLDSKNQLWISTAQSYIALIKNDKIINYDLRDVIGNKNIRSITEDNKGNLYLGTNGGGLYKFSNNKFTPVLEYNDKIQDKVIKSLFKDSRGNIWIGTLNKTYLLQNNKILPFYHEEKKLRNVRCIIEDKNGDIYFACGTRGLFKYSNNNLKHYDKENGLFWNDLLYLFLDKDNVIWIATSKGLFRFKNEKFTFYPMEGKAKDPMLFSCLEDKYGQLWISTNTGILKVNNNELNDYADGKISDFQVHFFGKDDGMLSTECNGGAQPCSAITNDGRIWFPTMNGVAVIDPDKVIDIDSIVLNIVIESVKINDSILTEKNILEKTASNDRIEIQYAALSFKNPAKNYYFYILEGFDKEWINAGKRTTAYYNNLPPGEYRFRVRASNSDGVWNESNNYLIIKIKPHFYQTFWFYILLSLFGIGIGYLIYTHKLKQLEKNEKKLSDLVNKRTEELNKELKERQQTEKLLKESEERYKFVIEGSNDAYYDWLIKENKVIFGQRWAEILETNYDDIKNFTQTWDSALHPEDKISILEKLHQHFEGKIDSFEAEYRIITHKGNIKWIYDRGKVIARDTQGNPLRICGVMSDITHKKIMEEELFKMKKIESIGILAGGIAHDFNNILTAILGNISLAKLKLGKRDLDRVEDLLTNSEKASIRAKDLTHQLLTFAKGGEPVIKTTKVDKIVTEAVNFAIHGSNVKPEIIIKDDTYPVDIDEGQISQVVQNIVINADQAMPKGGSLIITIENYHHNISNNSKLNLINGDYVKVSIKDSGIGMSKETMDKIFDPYFSTKETGHGLGLATTYSIIKKHNGIITVESELGQGSTFTFYLPKSKNNFDQNDKKKEIQIGKGKILVVESDEMLCQLFNEMLSNIGYEVITVNNSTNAIIKYKEAFYNKKFDCVILDLTIPGDIGGNELLEELRKLDKDVKAIITSGYSNNTILSNHKSFGYSGALSKPFHIEDVSKVIEEVLSKK